MAWTALVIAGFLEICWAIGLKYTEGFTKPIPSALTIAAIAASFWLLSIAMRSIPIGTAYAIWTGIGAAGAVIFGIIMVGEPANPGRLVAIALILSGIVMLKLFSPS
ncbi:MULTISPECIES: quaternary ammonium compound efflux SMR transporter SugE [Thalassospira]|jgi:quaternary ammonium compound-resistance protein SugE|uniref:Guanidinium exporter n=2 Tax=Thalassospira TaxID=168934 RepID=A0A367VB72_9PROT|nr:MULTISPECIES: quaternary ammonium compound efflux SMR transporter SugE [Thalassospira]PCI28103.1 MAG: quaternary ammonium compound-resistance protein SugE [Candidatus Kaiserbacteria bacterium]KZB72470.1 molecular chaperone [Thalassospira sp. MCCC 1A01148]MBC07041.1 quaternary ammonium compound-resistance protein SugE [Thalassospira sp.]MBO6808750.1 quaternary ammonium compound efflux SMR transporter SugE [Thalassospira sp.]MBO6840699.1 quaternary ammonium compound efflux SMR transporter Sug|tara:strand:- start:1083 stop:1403 length:321 start_codon:yes stop_codon:yes gene_type:complete